MSDLKCLDASDDTAKRTVSIIMPLFNSELHLSQTIESIRSQSHVGWQLYIVDDGSTDSSYSLAINHSQVDSRIHVSRLSANAGAAVARNKALESVTGRYIAFCDSDDIWASNKLETQLRALKESSDGICCSGYQRIDETGEVLGGVVSPPAVIDYQRLLRSNCIGMSTALVDTKVCGDIRLPEIRRRQDYALWLQLTRRGHEALGLQEPLVKYRVRSGSLSSNKIFAAYYHWRVLRELEGLPLYRCLKYFSQYCSDAVKKRNTTVQVPSE